MRQTQCINQDPSTLKQNDDRYHLYLHPLRKAPVRSLVFVLVSLLSRHGPRYLTSLCLDLKHMLLPLPLPSPPILWPLLRPLLPLLDLPTMPRHAPLHRCHGIAPKVWRLCTHRTEPHLNQPSRCGRRHLRPKVWVYEERVLRCFCAILAESLQC